MTVLVSSDGRMEVHATFPSFESHAIAAAWGCQGCGARLDSSHATDKGYPPGRGQYGNLCGKCGTVLFYDLKGGEAKRLEDAQQTRQPIRNT